ncbi:hypothetical protein HXK64_00255 [Candidatus Gracilibacteria bacterium]|nr:hypothetical protein [Candidatus Gracilibacteria bacterium]
MKLILLGLFTLVMVGVWIFFVILSIHAKKFANFSRFINKGLSFLFIFLLFLSISGYVLILFGDLSENPIGNFLNGSSTKPINLKEIDFSKNTTY